MKFLKTTLFYFNLANGVIPLIGVLFLGWSALDVFVLFILEIMFLGFFTLVKMLLSKGKKGSSIFLYCLLYPIAFLFIFILLGNFFDARNKQMNATFSNYSIYFLGGIYLFDLIYFYLIRGAYKTASARKIMSITFTKLFYIFLILLAVLLPVTKFIPADSQGILMGISILICRIVMDHFIGKRLTNSNQTIKNQ